MQRIIIDIPDNKYNFFMDLVKNLGLRKVKKLSKNQKEFVDDMKKSINEMELHRQSKIKLQSAKDFLDEV